MTAVFLVGALAAGGCEGLLGIRDPVLIEGETPASRDAAPPTGGAGDSGDVIDGGHTRGATFDAYGIPCIADPVIDVALARSDAASAQDRAIIALEDARVSICRSPLDGGEVDVIEFGDYRLQSMWIGDVTGNGTDDIAIIADNGVFLVRLASDGQYEVDEIIVDTVGTDPGFITGADLSGADAVDLIIAKPDVALLRQVDGAFFEEFQANIPPILDAVFAPLAASPVPDLIATTQGEQSGELLVRVAGEDSPHYQTEQRYPVDGDIGVLTTMREDGVLARVVAEFEEGLVIFEKVPAEPLLESPQYLLADIRGPFASGDLTGDGKDDLVGIGPTDAQGALWRSESDPPEVEEFPILDGVSSFAIADVDGDGLADILAGGPSGVIAYLQAP